jgi:hypothetical protein
MAEWVVLPECESLPAGQLPLLSGRDFLCASRVFSMKSTGLPLRARLDVAATAGVLREKIERLNKSIEKLRKQGAGQVADAQSAGFARIFQVEQDVVRTGLSVLLALVIESVCCFGLVVIAGAHPDARMGAGPSLLEWIGEWLTERAEPHPGTRISFRGLEADYRRWVDGRPAPKLSSRKFTRLIRAACEEVGLTVEGESVVGLQLISSRRMLTDRQSGLCSRLHGTGKGAKCNSMVRFEPAGHALRYEQTTRESFDGHQVEGVPASRSEGLFGFAE